MRKEIIYRNIAVFASILLILNIIFGHLDRFSNISEFIDFIVRPLTVLFTSLWLKSRITIAIISFFFTGYTIKLFLAYSSSAGHFDYYVSTWTATIFTVLGLILMLLALANYPKNGFFVKQIRKIELNVLATMAIVCLITYTVLTIIA